MLPILFLDLLTVLRETNSKQRNKQIGFYLKALTEAQQKESLEIHKGAEFPRLSLLTDGFV